LNDADSAGGANWLGQFGPLLIVTTFFLGCLAATTQLSSAPQIEGAQTTTAWRPETFTLANGMEVVVLPDHRAPVVTHMVWYRVGSADEPSGKSGIAHFLEHLMFKGTESIPDGEFSKIVARNGGQDNAFTYYDYTGYYQRVAVDRLALVMEMESERMTGLVLTDEVVKPERDVVLEERRSRTENNPFSLLVEQLSAARYIHHPYGTPVIGWMHEVSELTREDAETFYRAHYAPNNAILVVAGDVTGDDVRPLAEKFYGVIEPNDVPKRNRVKEPAPLTAKRLVLADPRATQARFLKSFIAPSYATADGNEAFALDVLMQILGGGDTSRLHRSLVVDQELAAGAGASYSGDALDDTTIGLYGVPNAGISIVELETALIDVVEKLKAEGVTDAEVRRAKGTLVAAATYARDSQQSMARIYGVALTTGQTVDDVVEWPDRIAEVTAEEINEVARKYFAFDKSVTGVLTPANPS
jgi:zinc protease